MSIVASISVAARATLNLHSLNNEGGEGNQIQTRMCNVVDDAGRLHTVNAISGDMMRHVVGEHLLRIAVKEGLPLSSGAREFNANRINADRDAMKIIDGKGSDREALDFMLSACAVTDIMGTLITESKHSLPRKSVVEFGWVVAIPGQVRTESYFHVKYSSERSAERRDQDRQDAESTGSNLGQAPFHRPASSGVYAIVCHLELARIGFNDLSQSYALVDDEKVENSQPRKQRARALIDAVLYSFLELNGAMRSAQLPHLTGLSGVVTWSSGIVPAPLISPLMGGVALPMLYKERAQGLAKLLNDKNGSIVRAEPFEDVQSFAKIMVDLGSNLQLADLTPGNGAK